MQLIVPVALHAVLVLAARHAVLVAVAQHVILATMIVTMDVAVKRNPHGKTGSVPSKMMDSKAGVAFNLAGLFSL